MSKRPLFFLSLAVFACGHALAAATAPSNDRIVANVDPDKRISLGEPRAAWISPAQDVGAVPDDLPLTQLSVVLKRSPERQQAFEQLIREQQDPASPNYHRWLSPREVGERFGATEHDLDAISGWLHAQGLSVDSVSNSRTRIRFSGSAAAVAAAFRTALRYYQTGNEKRIANASDAEIPAAFADAVASIAGLQTVRYRPSLHLTAPMQSRAASPEPAGTYCPGAGQDCQYNIFPADFAVIYNLTPLYQQNLRGSGQHIAVVGRARVYQPDIDHFQSLAGVSGSDPVVTVPPDGTDPGSPLSTCSDTSSSTCGNPSDAFNDQAEATLDVQRVGSVAPGAAIDLIVSDDTNSIDGINIAIDYAIDHDPPPAKVLSISFTSCEADNSRAVAESLDDFFGQAAAEGISVFVASGDAGVAGCAALDSAPQPGEPKSTNILCSSQYVTCVGGTEFADSENPAAYWHSTNAANFLSAIGYIPEGAWNEPLNSHGTPQLASSGGGISAYLPKPSWQTGPGVPGANGRYTPDVSLHASTHEGYFTCMAAANGSCVVATSGSFSFIAGGGTSASAPGIAGIAAILNQKTGSAQGNLNPRLYQLAQSPGNGVFHDVTVASSGVSGCTLATPSLCNNSTPGPSGLSGGLAGYMVGTGYDEATGLGSVDAANLVASWSGSSAAFDLDQVGLTGAWYNPATSGQGVVMQVAPDFYGPGRGLMFGGWFTFDTSAAGGQRWYSVQGEVDSGAASATMPIYRSEGGNFAAPPNVGVASVGEATFAFSDCTHGTLEYAFSDGSGRNGTIPLTRLGSNVSCSSSGGTPAPPSYLLSGAWYDPATSGQGLLFDLDPTGGTLFVAWYTYALNGAQIGGAASQRWYSMQASYTPGVATIGNIAIFESSGGVFDHAATVTTTQVGTASIAFTGCTGATLTYHFTGGANSGRQGSIPLVRVSPAVAGCSP
ncbi:MAG TPA: S53 family peptidase [Rhodanobacteraceae bacterium]|nr:S53 family peptidase [Rhodanobacteraceae bacterium]